MKSSIIRTVRVTVLWGLRVAFCSFCGCVASFFSVFVTVGEDYTQEETVGVISRKGFPVWFTETADGIRSGFHDDRFGVNCHVWTVFFILAVVLAVYAQRSVKRKRDDRKRQNLSCAEKQSGDAKDGVAEVTGMSRFLDKAGDVSLFIGAVLLPAGAFVIECATHLCADFIGFNPLATPWDVVCVACIPTGFAVLWFAVRAGQGLSAKWVHLLAVINGVALVFSAFYAIRLGIVVFEFWPLYAFWYSFFITLVPPVFLVHTPLAVFVSGLYLFRRLCRKAGRQDVFILRSLCFGILAGAGSIVVFYVFGHGVVRIF